MKDRVYMFMPFLGRACLLDNTVYARQLDLVVLLHSRQLVTLNAPAQAQ